ncbi:MAG: riboflavin synthase [Burkholderiales bacterium]|nr:riboflavin synthase [Burkholderiales bacterium]
MFTGIIEEIGQIREIRRNGQTLCLNISASIILEDVRLGDSIAVNGVCLTVTKFDKNFFTADVMPETFNNTTLHLLSRGSAVNLERALAANGRFGGHIVSGHIDGVAKVTNYQKNQNAIIYTIKLGNNLIKNCIAKGSIAIDGTSLTITKVKNDELEVSLIPHTQDKSILSKKKIGEFVNIECDILMKKSIQSSKAASNLDESFLRNNGFI